MSFPFTQKKDGKLLIREFSADVESGELVWHRDRADREVTVVEGVGWKIQFDDELPRNLAPGKTYYIPKNTYHRVMKGQTNLVVEIREDAEEAK